MIHLRMTDRKGVKLQLATTFGAENSYAQKDR
jgi:hypothetical protein